MKKVLPLLLALIGLGGGIAAGEMLRPGVADTAGTADAHAPEAKDSHAAEGGGGDHAAPAADHSAEPSADASSHGDAADTHAAATPDAHSADDGHGGVVSGGHGEAAQPGPGWFTFPTQFFVPLVRNGDMGAMMILTLSLEAEGAQIPDLARQEHRLRDALLRQLLIHANTGGFDGNFTAEAGLAPLRISLLKAVSEATPVPVVAVLIEAIVRQAG